MAHPIDTSDATFEADVLQNDQPVLVDFWAPWCGPCRMVAPVVEELSNDYDGRVKFVKLNTDDNPGVSAKYGIRSIPTLLIFKGGELKGQVVGFRPKGDLAKHLESALLA
ncbi:MAG: thioredoxin [Dehalococcoidia bacterium]|nr:thioredoxin [Dehalococcoidia bacterium]